MPDYTKYIEKGLTSTENKELAIQSMTSILELINIKISENLIKNHFLQVLKISKDPNVDKELTKFPILIFTDYILNSSHKIDLDLFRNIFESIIFAFQFSSDTIEISENEEMFEYRENVREHLLEFLNIVLYKIENVDEEEFVKEFEVIFKFLYEIVNVNVHTPNKLSALLLIGSFYNIYPDEVRKNKSLNIKDIKNKIFEYFEISHEFDNDMKNKITELNNMFLYLR